MRGVPWREVNTGVFFFSLPRSLSLALPSRLPPPLAPLSRFFLPHNKEAVARVDLQRLPVLASA